MHLHAASAVPVDMVLSTADHPLVEASYFVVNDRFVAVDDSLGGSETTTRAAPLPTCNDGPPRRRCPRCESSTLRYSPVPVPGVCPLAQGDWDTCQGRA